MHDGQRRMPKEAGRLDHLLNHPDPKYTRKVLRDRWQ